MADSASESDTDGAGSSSATLQCSASSSSSSKQQGFVISPFRLEELTNRLASLQQENKVLKIELETFKLKCKALQEENRDLRKASVTIVSADLENRVQRLYTPDPVPGARGVCVWVESGHWVANGLFEACFARLANAIVVFTSPG
ncbi:coiled-coil domain-containing protein 6 [Silurus asotus]|uniref:Coiled-coil domain-containing protein 6 n=1 Tax=Silurus asotus TaxID=30991 RepID=A0AAD5A1R2_SILAS|nr:coiled-coil domain-containing protein 6 [Silurus asotus]